MTTTTCVIRRTGRRATGTIVTLESGARLRLSATGAHVAELSAADIRALRALPNTAVSPVPATAPTPAPTPALAPAKPPRIRKRSKKAAE